MSARIARRLAASVLAFGALAAPAQAALPPTLTDADVAPLPWSTTPATDVQARALAAQGRCAEAARLVDAPGAGARVVKAWLLDCAHDAPGVVAATEGLAEALPTTAPLVSGLRAEALLTLERAPEALAALGCVATPEARRLRARALREVGDHGAAALAYKALIESDDREDRALGLLGMARLTLDRGARGFDAPLTSPATERMRDWYRELRCFPPGAPDFSKAPRSEAEVTTLLDAIAWHSELAPPPKKAKPLGPLQEALLALRRLDVEHPTHWAAATGRKLAAQQLAAEPALAPFYETRTPAERIARAERLLDVHRNEEALADLDALPKAALELPLQCRALAARGKAHKKLRQWEKARTRLGEAAEVCFAAKSDQAPGALFHYAAALERLSDEKASAAAYERLRARFPKHTLADDAGFFLIRHALDDLKDWKAARAIAEKLVAENPEGDLVGEAVFFVSSAAMAEDRWRDAQAVLRLNDKLPPPFFTDHDAGRTEYWRARVAQQMKMPLPGIVEGYERVFTAMPLGWYSLLAYSRLRELDPDRARASVLKALGTDPARADVPGGPGDTWSFAVPPGFDAPALETAVQLARLGLAQPARDALEAAASAETPETLWFSAWVLDRAGAYRYSHDLLRRKLKNYRTFGATGAQSRIWRMAFPAPYRELVTQAETDTGVPAAFLWGIMREESGFNPGVESSANAVGLMQLILPTAQRMAALTKEDEGTVTLATLTDPRVSVRLGARYLQHVLDQVGGRAALPILPAGYNAGEGALKRWLKARGDLPLDLFVEHMTFEEARWYTKRVVSSYATYRFLYFGGDADRDPLPYFPQKLPR